MKKTIVVVLILCFVMASVSMGMTPTCEDSSKCCCKKVEKCDNNNKNCTKADECKKSLNDDEKDKKCIDKKENCKKKCQYKKKVEKNADNST